MCLPTKFHCVNCGRVWGDGPDIGSAGFCMNCFAEWARNKMPCFGTKAPTKEDCKFFMYCKEFYGIK